MRIRRCRLLLCKRNRQLLEELKRLSREVKKAQETICARDEFISIASHELKTPLTSLIMQHQLLTELASNGNASVTLSTEQYKRILESSSHQMERLSKRINELMDVSRIRAGKMELKLEKVDLAKLVYNVTSQFSDQLAQEKCPVKVTGSHPYLDTGIQSEWNRWWSIY